jgi:hypothetical protein
MPHAFVIRCSREGKQEIRSRRFTRISGSRREQHGIWGAGDIVGACDTPAATFQAIFESVLIVRHGRSAMPDSSESIRQDV